ncbi:uclacyanin 1 [Striga hermonthica]|uniref:Uclacyanin 1 n=1 Tax=Striga hermonthica TaxID=68872 RepID=A0A9N7RRX8_STRHE|nr:uclacyanin 1 [Striga hermonthica]
MAGERGTANSVAATALVMMVAVTLLVDVAQAEQYIVGGDGVTNGWDLHYDANWVKDKNFKVGDKLVFLFDLRFHDVMEVSKSDYDNCQPNPRESWNSEPTIVNLNATGTRYFICSTSGHCNSGMKIAVTTGN